MPDFSVRSTLLEKMDEPDIPEHELRQNLRELETVNTLLGGYSVVLNALSRMQWGSEPVRIMDMGCGGGDMLRAISKWAKQKGYNVSLTGIDYNPVMIQYATEHSQGYKNIDYRHLSIFDEQLLKERTDIIVCSLFCHHFKNEELIPLLKRMKNIATKAIIVNDLHRHWFAYYAISILTSIFSKTYLVKHDAKLSVARAFNRKDLEEIMKAADIAHYSLNWRWAWRWELIINIS